MSAQILTYKTICAKDSIHENVQILSDEKAILFYIRCSTEKFCKKKLAKRIGYIDITSQHV